MKFKIHENTELPQGDGVGKNICIEIEDTNKEEIKQVILDNPEFNIWFNNTEETYFVIWKLGISSKS